MTYTRLSRAEVFTTQTVNFGANTVGNESILHTEETFEVFWVPAGSTNTRDEVPSALAVELEAKYEKMI